MSHMPALGFNMQPLNAQTGNFSDPFLQTLQTGSNEKYEVIKRMSSQIPSWGSACINTSLEQGGDKNV
jgi:hypothetical protein